MAEQESATQCVVMADDPATPIAVEVTRGGMVESVHRVAAAVVDRHGGARLTWGDDSRPIFPRSAIKPLQALTVIESGAADAFDLSADEIALSCASHRGEPMHVMRVAAWLERSPDFARLCAHPPSQEHTTVAAGPPTAAELLAVDADPWEPLELLGLHSGIRSGALRASYFPNRR